MSRASWWLLWLALGFGGGHRVGAEADWVPAPDGELPEQALLAVGVAPLAPLAVEGDDEGEHAEVLREAEARTIAHRLRAELERSRVWGPARLLPAVDPSAEVLIDGRVLESLPDRLAVWIVARDATGRVWLDRRFEAAVVAAAGRIGDGPLFAALYGDIARALESARGALSLKQLDRIIQVSRMRYAAALLPAVFGDYLASDAGGAVVLRRLPADDDPLMARVERVREAEYLFIDAVDRTLGQHVIDLAPTLDAWRKARLESERLMDRYRQSSARKRNRDRALKQVYNQFREIKFYQDSLRRDLAAFAFEVGPTRLELAGELVELTGSLDQQQRQWRGLLQRIHLEAVGLPEGTAGATNR